MSLVDNFIHILHHSADLVNAWGSEEVSGGRTLKDALTIREVSLWDILAPELAIYHVPKALSAGSRAQSIGERVRPRLSLVKHKVNSFLQRGKTSEGCAKWPTDATCLFLGFNDYIYRDALLPVITRFEEEHEISTVSLYDRQNPRKAAGTNSVDGRQSIWSHWDDDARAEAAVMVRTFRKVIKDLLSKGELPRIIRDSDRSLWRQAEPAFMRLFKVGMPDLLIHAAAAKHVFRHHCPAAIISADGADPRARIYYLLGSQRGIPVMEIMFADIVAMDAISWKFFIADRLTVSGVKAGEVIQKLGVAPELITVTGSPRYDGFAAVPEEVRGVSHSGNKGRVMVLFASTLSLSSYDELVDPAVLNSVKKTVFQAADQVEGIDLIVKPHPLEDVSLLKHLAEGHRNISFVEPGEDIRELTKACDVFITLGSTATLGAIILNKPVIWPAFTGTIWWEEEDHFLQSGATLVIRSLEELVSCLQGIARGSRDTILKKLEEPRDRFLQEWVYKTDGRASSRIEAVIRSLIGRRSAP